MFPRRRALVTAAKHAIFSFVLAISACLPLILTVAAVQTVAATIMPGCFGNRGPSRRGTRVRRTSGTWVIEQGGLSQRMSDRLSLRVHGSCDCRCAIPLLPRQTAPELRD